MTISEVHNKLKAGVASCEEIIKESFSRAEKLEPKLNAYITLTPKVALEQAKEYDKEIAKIGFDKIVSKKPLVGIPVAFKDLFTTKGIETTAGSKILKGYIPPYEATCVRKFRNAGAIMIGKLNEDAFGHGGTGQNSDYGVTKNPYDLKRVPGGSSSGAGVAVATESVVSASGTDTGGSVRNPASFTNTVGIKPTYGLVSRYGIIAMSSSLDSVGHITQIVEDNARVLQVTAGFDVNDSTSSKREVPDYLIDINKGVKGLKIGVPKEYVTNDVDIEVCKVINSARKTFEKLGATTVDISLPHTQYALAVYYIIMPSEVSSNLGRFDGIRFGHTRSFFGDEAKRRIMIGTYTLSAGFYDEYYLKAQKVRTLIRQDFENAYKNVDVILAPVAPVLPPKIGEDISDPMKMYLIDVLTAAANVAGIPAIGFPGGFSDLGLPVGIQLMCNNFDEKLLYRVAQAFEKETQFYKFKPKL